MVYVNEFAAGLCKRPFRGAGMRRGFLLGAACLALALGFTIQGSSSAFGAVASLGRMASLPAGIVSPTHKVSFTFVPAEQGAVQRSSNDSSDDPEDADDKEESDDIVSSSEPVKVDDGPVIVGTTSRYQAEAARNRSALSDAVPVRSARNRSHPALTVTDEPPPMVSAQAKTSRPALTFTDDSLPSAGVSSGIRPHMPDALSEGVVSPEGYAPSAKSALTKMDGQPWSVDASQSSVRPHRPDLLVYGEAAAAQKALAASPERYAKALSADILSRQEAPAPASRAASATVAGSEMVVPSVEPAPVSVAAPRETVAPVASGAVNAAPPATMAVAQAVSMPLPVVQQELAAPSARARNSASDSFDERTVVARSDRALAAQASASDDAARAVAPSQVSSVTFPSASAVVAARPVSGGGMVPSMRPPAVVAPALQSASYPAGGFIKASVVTPAATSSSAMRDRQIAAPPAQIAQAQAVQAPAPAVRPSLAPMMPQAAGNPSSTSDAKVYEITDVAVDVKADSAAHARDQALAKAQKAAFGQLLERLGSDVAAADAITADALAGLMQSFEVQNERASSSRYIGMFTIQFKPSAVRGWLGQTKSSYSEERSGPMVVLPVYINNGQPVLWEERTRWRVAWENSARDSGLVPVIVPDGELDDIAVVSTEEAASGRTDSLKALAAKYHAVGTAVAVLKGSFDHSTAGFSAQMQRVDAMGNAAPLETISLPVPEVGRSGSDAMLALSVKKVRQQLEADWRRERSLASTGVTMASVPAVGVKGVAVDDDASQGVMVRLRALVPVSSNAGLEDLRQRMAHVPGLPRVDVLSLQSGSARVELGISSSIEDVQAALLEREIELRQDPIGGGWSLRALQ